MAREDSFYGNEYLTGAQQLEEDFRLAPGGPVAAGNRLSENVASLAAANAQNPLLAPRDSGLGTVAAGRAVTTPVTAVQPNPMIRPPVDFNMMPVEKQVAWQALAVKQQADQDAAEKRALDTAVLKSQNDLRLEKVRQGNEFMKELPRLQALLAAGKHVDYSNLRSEFVSKHPLALGTEEVQAAIKDFDDQHGRLVGFEENRNKTKAAIEEKALQKSIDDGFEMVKPLGPEKQKIYAALVATDPAKAIQYAADIAAPAQRENTIQKLRDQGFSDEDIAKYGTGAEFKYQAADEAAKSRAALRAEKYKVGQDLHALYKERGEAVLLGQDTAGLDQRIKDGEGYLNSLTPRLGVQGMPSQGETYTAAMGYERNPRATRPVVPVQPAQPTVPVGQIQATAPATGPVRSEAVFPSVVPAVGRLATVAGRMATAPMRLMAMSEAERAAGAARTPTPTAPMGRPTPTPAPKPAPAPPPLNPAYPEHWVGGKRYIQMPDGKLYLSKVQ